MSDEELQEAIEYNQNYMEARLSEELFGGDYTSAVELESLEKDYDKLNREVEIKNAYCQLIVDLGFDYDGSKKEEDLKKLIDELVKYAFASKNNDDSMVIYEDGLNKKYNILYEELECKHGK